MRASVKKTIMIGAVLVVGAGLSACTNRPLSMMDTHWGTNSHPYLVQQPDGSVVYSDDSVYKNKPLP